MSVRRHLRVAAPLVLLKRGGMIRHMYRGELIPLDEVGAPIDADQADVDRLLRLGAIEEV
ncbi:hypothetical protein NBCG_01074 [Nocardioidaceae bacterium Broad-1]|nr:hypothetical protein NBCG_01074 [Nocardioidaceae bacterium Broad-1]